MSNLLRCLLVPSLLAVACLPYAPPAGASERRSQRSPLRVTNAAQQHDPPEWDGRFVGINPDNTLGWTYDSGTPAGSVPPVRPVNGSPAPASRETIWYINGVNTSFAGQFATLQSIANHTGQPVIGVRNATAGLAHDVGQSYQDFLRGPMNPATRTLSLALESELKAGRTVHLMGHSQGALIISRALLELRDRLLRGGAYDDCQLLKLLNRVKVETFGSPASLFIDGPSYIHTCNLEDPICNPDVKFGGIINGIDSLGRNAAIQLFEDRRPWKSGAFGDHDMNNVYVPHRGRLHNDFPEPPGCLPVTVFVIDASGSMAEGDKIGQASAALQEGLDEMVRGQWLGGMRSPVSVVDFSGPCSPGSVRTIFNFTYDVLKIKSAMRQSFPAPGGETPLPEAIDAVNRRLLDYLNRHPDVPHGEVILLSDGQSTCGAVRPAGAFSRERSRVGRNSLAGGDAGSHPRVNFLTVGFGISPGSGAERDLQYLASRSDGRYYNAQDQRQLSRAFRRFTRLFPARHPVPRSGSPNLPGGEFSKGVKALQQRDYEAAVKSFQAVVAAAPQEPAGLFNLAQALEATDRFKGAVQYYRRYVQAMPKAKDAPAVEKKIGQLRQDYADHVDYHIKLLKSDEAYLKNYYRLLFNRANRELAAEFAGFVAEKGEFYSALNDVFEVTPTWLENGSRDLADSLYTLADRVHLTTFDRDAVSLLPLTISQLGELTELLESKRDQIIAIP
jgi:Mg-chelatase subunit ChlD